MSSPIEGAWELESDSDEGIFVCTETHYSFFTFPKGRLGLHDEPTPEEVRDSYKNVNALAGTYTVSGSKVTFHRSTSLNADMTDLDLEVEFTIEDGKLTTRVIRGAKEGTETVWRKIG